MSEFDDLISASETAAMVGQQVQTLATWRCEGRGPAFYKLGRQIFYRKADISAWLATRRRDPVRKAIG